MSCSETTFCIQYKEKLPTLEQVEVELVAEAVFINETIEKAAEMIGVSDRHIYRVMRNHNLSTKKIRSLHHERLKLKDKKNGQRT